MRQTNRATHRFLQLIRHLKIDVDYRPFYDDFGWRSLFRCLNASLPSLEIPVQRYIHFRYCNTALRDMHPTHLTYEYLFDGLYKVFSVQISGTLRVFPQLESLKVFKVESECKK